MYLANLDKSRKICTFSFCHLNHKKPMVLVMEVGKWIFHPEYQLLGVNELQSGIILHVFYKHRIANKLGFSLSCSDKCFKLAVF